MTKRMVERHSNWMKPCSITIFLFDGDPTGIRVAQVSMSTIQAVAFRRNQLRRVREDFPEIKRPGVYVLVGSDENEPERQLAYIGESENVDERLSYHNSNETGPASKDFWTDTVVLISKDENLTKSHARYIESCLIRSVHGNPRWSLPNMRTPSDDAGKLPLPDRVAMDEFVGQTKTLAGALGWDLFREMRGPTPETTMPAHSIPQDSAAESPRFSLRGKGFAAEMEIGWSGDFVVRGSSKARVKTTRTIPRRIAALRHTLLGEGVLRQDGDFLVFTSDYRFSSASAAAATVVGTSANGRILWRLPNGRTYADWESNQELAGGPSGAMHESS